MMGFQEAGICSSRCGSFFQYERLECLDDVPALQPRRRWLPSLNGKAACSCFFHLKKLKWSRITSALLPRKVADFSSKIRHTSASDADEVCPTIVFLSQWGLPVLSRPSLALAGGGKGKYHHGRSF